jgi:non-ribosomal peptide synthetase component F
VFQAMFVLQDAQTGPQSDEEFEEIGQEHTAGDITAPDRDGVAKFDLTMALVPCIEQSGRLGSVAGVLNYNTDLFDGETAGRVARQSLELVRSRSALELIPEEELKLLSEWNPIMDDLPDTTLLKWGSTLRHQRTQDEQTVAVISEQIIMTYTDLDKTANDLAIALGGLGVIAGSVVAICVPRTISLAVALFAVLKVEAAYVPIDLTHPANRVAYMIENSVAQAALLELDDANALPKEFRGSVVKLDTDGSVTEISATEPGFDSLQGSVQLPTNTMYIMYTSGSTGRPKGCMGSHAGVINRLQWMYSAYPFGQEEICCAKTALTFVDSVWEIFGPLIGGAPLVMLSHATVRDPQVRTYKLKYA